MGTAQVGSTSALGRMRTNRWLDGMRNNRYRLPAKFYFILWLTLWVSAVGSFLLGVWEGLDVAMVQTTGLAHSVEPSQSVASGHLAYTFVRHKRLGLIFTSTIARHVSFR